MNAFLPLCEIHSAKFTALLARGVIFDQISYDLTERHWGVYLRIQNTGEEFLVGDFLTLPLAIAYAEALEAALELPIRYPNGEVIYRDSCG